MTETLLSDDDIFGAAPAGADALLSDDDIFGSPGPAPVAPPAAAADRPGALSRGFVTGLMEQNPEMGAEALEGFSHLAPEALASSFRSGSDYLRGVAGASPAAYKPTGRSMWDIGSLDEALTWAGETVGQGVASSVVPFTMGLAGAGAGAGVGAVTAGPPGAAIGATLGAGAGALSGSFPLNYGEVYKALKDEGVDPRRAAEVAGYAAVPMAALDAWNPASLVGKAVGLGELRREVARNIAKRIAAEAGKSAGREGVTEGMQEAVKAGTVSAETGKPFFTVETAKAIAENAVAGALTGGAMGAVAGVKGDRVSPPAEPARGGVSVKPYAGPDQDGAAQPGVPAGAVPASVLYPEAPEAAAEPPAGEPITQVDTGQTVPESLATLQAQQDQLVRGERAVQMFPAGTPALDPPDGMAAIDVPGTGTFHYNPALIDEDAITQAAVDGRLNDILGLGSFTKAEVIQREMAGEAPVVVTERAPDGTEVRAAAGTVATAAQQAAEVAAVASPGHAVAVEAPEEVVAGRLAGATEAPPAEAVAAPPQAGPLLSDAEVFGSPAAAPAAEPSVKKSAARRAPGRPLSLLEYIASRGGVKPDADWRHMGMSYKSRVVVPGAGYRSLLRGGGMTMDELVEALREGGYIAAAPANRPDDSGLHRRIRDLVREEQDGRAKTYPIGAAPEPTKADRAKVDEQNETDIRRAVEDGIRALGGDLSRATPEEIDRTIALVRDEGLSPDEAFERAVIQVALDKGLAVEPEAADIFGPGVLDEVYPATASRDGAATSAEGREGARSEAPQGSAGRGDVVPSARGDGETQAAGRRDAGVTERTAAGEQRVLPGAERIGQGEQARRAAERPMRGRVPQKEAGGLFSDEASQTDLVDMARTAARPKPLASERIAEIAKKLSREQGGFSAVPIAGIVRESGQPVEAVHEALKREAKAGRLTMHPTTRAEADHSAAERAAWLTLPGFDRRFASVTLIDQSKQGTVDEAPDGAMAQRVAPGFYSAVERAITNFKQPRAAAGQWIGAIKNAPGIKPEELEWLGLEAWLKEQTGTVTKDQVLDYVRANQIEVKEVVRKDRTDAPDWSPDEAKQWLQETTGRDPNEEYGFRNPDDYVVVARQLFEARSNNGFVPSGTKYGQYTLPGGQNYRELLLTLPDKNMAELERLMSRDIITDNESRRIVYLRNQVKSDRYKSSHWEEPNILAHVRFDDRVSDGKKTLHIAEIQSDWHQAGRKRGYRRDRAVVKKEYEAAIAEANRHAVRSPEYEEAYTRARRLATELNDSDPVPDAPFKTTWPELALKRMIRYAAENGYERITWDTGATSADRYDLSKQVDYLLYKQNEDGTYRVSAQVQGRGQMLGENLTPDKLEEYVGKDVAQRIVDGAGDDQNLGGSGSISQPTDIWKKLEGGDLKVGGEGMVGFYDKILPAAAQKLVKKYGAKVERAAVETDTEPRDVLFDVLRPDGSLYRPQIVEEEFAKKLAEKIGGSYQEHNPPRVPPTPVHSLDITPELRKAAVEQGFPLFDRGRQRIVADGRRMTRSSVEREIIQRYDQIEGLRAEGADPRRIALVSSIIESLETALAKADGPKSLGRLFPRTRVVPAGDGRYAVRVSGPEQTGDENQRVYRIHRMPAGGLAGIAKPSKQLGRPLGQVSLFRRPDGRWEVEMVQVTGRHRGKGVAKALYGAVQADLGIEMQPSGILLPDGYAMWKKRSPERVRFHQPVRDDLTDEISYYLSPRRIKDALDVAEQKFGSYADLRRTPVTEPRGTSPEDRFSEYLDHGIAELNRLRDLWAKVPEEGRQPDVLASMFRRPDPSDPAFAALDDLAQVSADLRAELDRMGLSDVGLKVSDEIRMLIDGVQTPINGYHWRNVIGVSLASPDRMGTLRHESIHAMKALGLISDPEWRALERRAPKWRRSYEIDARYGDQPLDVRTEEAIAEAFKDWVSDPSAVKDPFIVRLFKRLRNLLEALGNTLRGNGFRTADDVFSAIESGDVGRRGRADNSAMAAPLAQRQDTETADGRKRTMLDMVKAGQPIDRALRMPFDLFGGFTDKGEWKPGLKLFNKASDIIVRAEFKPDGRFAFLNSTMETIRSGLIDRYSLRDLPAYVERERKRTLDERAVMLQGSSVLNSLADHAVGPEEATVLQAVLTGEAVPTADMAKLAEPIRQAIDALGEEAVALGLVSRESFERNRGTYLHRVYKKHEMEENGLARMVSQIMGSKRKKLIGNQFKGRGLFQDMPVARLMRDVPGWTEAGRGVPEMGERFLRLDEIGEQSALEEGQPKSEKVLRTVWWPADEPVPARYDAFRTNGTWEVRGKKGGTLTLWRDFTKAEREKMGEILDARYTIGKTFMLMAHDLANGRFYKDIAENADWASTARPEGSVVDAEEWAKQSRRMKGPGGIDWVRVPDTTIADTGGKKRWGALAGKYVREAIWRDLNEIDIMQRPTVWRTLLTQWKLNKTARSPVVHMNNVMSNFVLMDLIDARWQDLVAGVRSYATGDADYQEALEHGAFGADQVSQEIRDNILKPVLDEIAGQTAYNQGGPLGMLGHVSRYTDALWSHLKYADKKMISLYQLEDEVFRMAVYKRRRELGDDPKAAADEARLSFVDYDIRAPWVQAARNSVLPFISYTYRAAPLLARAIATRPWKLAKYATLGFLANALAYAVLGDAGDEKKERKALRDEEQGRTWFGTPRMLRLPMNDRHGLPLFLDVRRWVPGGDIFDVTQSNAAIPMLPWLSIGGPMAIGGEFFFNRQAFTNKDIVNGKTDDWWDRTSKVSDWAWKAWVPSAAYVPNSWYWEKVQDAIKGGTDRQGRPYSTAQALASSVGVKVKPVDPQDAMAQKGAEFAKVERELSADLSRLEDQFRRKLISKLEYDRGKTKIIIKFSRLRERATEALGGR